MLGLARKSPTSAPAQGDPRTARVEMIYDRRAAGLYRQALLTLDDQSLAEQVVAEVIIAECTRPAAADRDASTVDRRLAVSTYWRCQELSPSSAQRGVLALVFFGDLGYAQASDELAIPRRDLAAMLHGALRTLAAAPDTSPGGAAGT